MKIEPKLKFISLSNSGKEITLKDETLDYTNGDYVVEGVIVKLSSAFSAKDSYVEFDDTTTPTFTEVIGGKAFKVNSVLTDDSTLEQGLRTYKDGVLEINYYPYVNSYEGIGKKGTHYIITTDSFEVLENFEAIVVGDSIYNIDKTKSGLATNAGTLLYTVEELKEDFTEFYPSYRSTLRVLVETTIKQAIAEGATALAYPHNRTNGLKEAVKKLNHNYISNRILFENKNYGVVNLITKESYQIINLYKLGRC